VCLCTCAARAALHSNLFLVKHRSSLFTGVLFTIDAAWRHFEWNILPPSCGSFTLVSNERFVQNSDSTWTVNVHRTYCRCPHCSTYTHHSFCRCFIDDETFVLLHGACYRVSGIVPLWMALMRPFKAIKLLWSGKCKRTSCILHTPLSSTLQMYKGVGIAPVIGRQDSTYERTIPPPRRQNVRIPPRGEFRPRQTRQLPRAVDLKGRLLSCQSY